MEQIYCHSCGRVATVYVDMMLVITPASPTSTQTEKRKHAGVWLCEDCLKLLRRLMTRDTELQERVAAALTSKPRVIYRTYAGGQNAD